MTVSAAESARLVGQLKRVVVLGSVRRIGTTGHLTARGMGNCGGMHDVVLDAVESVLCGPGARPPLRVAEDAPIADPFR